MATAPSVEAAIANATELAVAFPLTWTFAITLTYIMPCLVSAFVQDPRSSVRTVAFNLSTILHGIGLLLLDLQPFGTRVQVLSYVLTAVPTVVCCELMSTGCFSFRRTVEHMALYSMTVATGVMTYLYMTRLFAEHPWVQLGVLMIMAMTVVYMGVVVPIRRSCGYTSHLELKQQPMIPQSLPQCVAIEGNIAVGKSTLCTALSASGKVHVEKETILPSLLRLFQSNIAKYAFAFQLHVMESRIHSWMRTQMMDQPAWMVLDRCCIGDVVFAIKQFLDGNINANEWKVYLSAVRSCVQSMRTRLNGILYLHSDVQRCHKSLLKRGEADHDLPESYLNSIDEVYFYTILAWIMYTPVPVRVEMWSKQPDLKIRTDDIKRYIDFSATKSSIGRICVFTSKAAANRAAAQDKNLYVVIWDDPDMIEEKFVHVGRDRVGYQPGWTHTSEFRNKVMLDLARGRRIGIVRTSSDSRNGLWEHVSRVWKHLLDGAIDVRANDDNTNRRDSDDAVDEKQESSDDDTKLEEKYNKRGHDDGHDSDDDVEQPPSGTRESPRDVEDDKDDDEYERVVTKNKLLGKRHRSRRAE